MNMRIKATAKAKPKLMFISQTYVTEMVNPIILAINIAVAGLWIILYW
ncbi:MAG: hypothetical protein QF486_04200 [Candidatus Woesearchaeota archaeon]|jgi:hypothetical protein|nr:hypothetical protein [Candidatus Woesearchaeota archaeon]MDP7181705.1 hypothetical protein [Candidatus Woesearchaeota archaeon]MDP7198794.1 hypothetical protein [Candidatus Woesearchaeota archaeon]MDP7467206.1 hypothetical protein [Candidatus Woesearchaeota archaeon]MDP7647459.1 hypothetical protein [Candidatus Woesearchaeota archaeon]